MAVACLALFVALGGTGYAASGGLSNGGPATIAKKHKRVVLRGPRGPRGPRGLTGPAGPTGPQGPAGAAGAPGAAGTAKAYAEISHTGAIVPGHAFNIANANITHPSTGIYCIDVSGVGITTANAAPIATLDWADAPVLDGDSLLIGASDSLANNCTNRASIEVRTVNTSNALTDLGFVIAFM